MKRKYDQCSDRPSQYSQWMLLHKHKLHNCTIVYKECNDHIFGRLLTFDFDSVDKFEVSRTITGNMSISELILMVNIITRLGVQTEYYHLIECAMIIISNDWDV